MHDEWRVSNAHSSVKFAFDTISVVVITIIIVVWVFVRLLTILITWKREVDLGIKFLAAKILEPKSAVWMERN